MVPLRLTAFQVTNFRNIHDGGWVDVDDLTAIIGPNESGKSNLCEALFRLRPYDDKTTFDINFDWPIDLWEKKDPKAVAIGARFS
jgi:AAA15 family ATPase/GTPase